MLGDGELLFLKNLATDSAADVPRYCRASKTT